MKRKRERDSLLCADSVPSSQCWARLKPEASCCVLYGYRGQALGPSSTAFSKLGGGSWKRSGATKTQSMTLLCCSADPYIYICFNVFVNIIILIFDVIIWPHLPFKAFFFSNQWPDFSIRVEEYVLSDLPAPHPFYNLDSYQYIGVRGKEV